MAATGPVMLGFTPGETVIVTGAGSGIGRSTALNAAAVGLAVAAWDINAESAAETARVIQQAGGKAVPVAADVTDWYPATKAAALGYTRHLAAYRADVVRANAVAPGLTDTPRMAGFADSGLGKRILGRIPLHRMGTSDEISWAILFLLSPLASYINGILLTVDGGWTITQ